MVRVRVRLPGPLGGRSGHSSRLRRLLARLVERAGIVKTPAARLMPMSHLHRCLLGPQAVAAAGTSLLRRLLARLTGKRSRSGTFSRESPPAPTPPSSERFEVLGPTRSRPNSWREVGRFPGESVLEGLAAGTPLQMVPPSDAPEPPPSSPAA
jgi:hypothetical protein